ncbi:alpha/beta fold hydrolase [Thermosipho ferrireducens]|uniref:Alpha/beta fold hydrolase n=1 Tax=Thermosipho ferrireducens TaxID=2571116 RepID=A0ABX7S8L5_9BACT|nr:alpha/beta fold hydrolase [Thermosipho ferrireducens]
MVWILILLILPVLLLKLTFVLTIITLVMIYSIAAIGLNLIMGYVGQISIGHAAFMSIGAYTSAIFVLRFDVPILVGVILGTLLSFIFGIILGFPALRLSGFYLAIATMGFGIAVEQIMGAWENVTGGHIGIRNIPFYDFANNDLLKYYFVFAILFISYYIFDSLINGKYGRAWKTIRENEKAAVAMGINLSKYKVLGFAIGSAFSGLAGALYAHVVGYISPADFGLAKSLDLLTIVVIGGLGLNFGPFFGSIIYTGLPFFLSRTEISLSIVFGSLLIVVVLFMPRGIGYYVYLLELKYLSKISAWIRRGRKMRGKLIKTRIGNIHYLESGQGENNILFVHGNFASSLWYKELMNLLPENYKAFALDLPNFGYSDPIDNISIHSYAEALNAFVEAVNLDKFILVGHSLGGAVVIDYLINYSEKVEKLILVDPAPIDGLKTPEESYPILELYRNNPELLKKAIKAIAPTYTNDNFFDEAVSDALRMNPKCFTENARALEKINYTKEVKKINTPVTVIWGDKDIILSKEQMEKTSKAFKNGKLITLSGIGHSPILEAPDRVLNVVIQ